MLTDSLIRVERPNPNSKKPGFLEETGPLLEREKGLEPSRGHVGKTEALRGLAQNQT